jgi:hypothetical protein
VSVFAVADPFDRLIPSAKFEASVKVTLVPLPGTTPVLQLL